MADQRRALTSTTSPRSQSITQAMYISPKRVDTFGKSHAMGSSQLLRELAHVMEVVSPMKGIMRLHCPQPCTIHMNWLSTRRTMCTWRNGTPRGFGESLLTE